MAINSGFNNFKMHSARFCQMMNDTVFQAYCLSKLHLPTDGITKQHDFEQPNVAAEEEMFPAMEVPKTRENKLFLDATTLIGTPSVPGRASHKVFCDTSQA
eukprot:2371718-Ditylum_brightwellii.AAC.1